MKVSISALALTIPAILLGACASDSAERTPKYSRAVQQCPPGETLICEVPTTGRIHHGSFSKRGKSCACEEPRAGATVIPSVDH